MNNKWFLSFLVALVMVMFLAGCSPNDEPGGKHARGTPLNLEAAAPVELKLQDYNGGFFTMKIPENWVVETTGEYENFGFRAHDPDCPGRQIFFYGNMKPFLKSIEAKEFWNSYLAGGGYGDAQLYADAPVLSPPTTEQFYSLFGDFAALAEKYGIVHNFPRLNELRVLESMPQNSPIGAQALDDTIIRALFTDDGIPCEGLFAGSVFDLLTYDAGGVDSGHYAVYVVTGISAPADEFLFLEETLAQSLGSFQFDQSYIQQGVAKIEWETEKALEIGKTLSEANDSYNQAWHDRQPAKDTVGQKDSDKTLGYDRLYDTETGETYRAELGFYDEYDHNRDQFANPNLERVPDDGYELYGKPVSGYIYK
ncbi:MAG: hypothetical protein ACOX30_05620 [Dethiobacteria bacterium]|jgi:hypothetical protein